MSENDESSQLNKSTTPPQPAPRLKLKSRERRKVARLRKAAKRAKVWWREDEGLMEEAEADLTPHPRYRRYRLDRPDCWPDDLPRRQLMTDWRRGLEEVARGERERPHERGERRAMHIRHARRELGWEIVEIEVPALHDRAAKKRFERRRPLLRFYFAKGEPVPTWLEDTLTPGFFGTDVVCVVGSIRRLRKRYRGLFLPAARRSEPDWTSSYMAPARSLAPDECLIRYPGAGLVIEEDTRFKYALRKDTIGFRTGFRNSATWALWDEDCLFMAASVTDPAWRPSFGEPLPGQRHKPEAGADGFAEVIFAKGEPVPNWLEDTTYSGLFDVDTRCVIGPVAAMFERYPDLPRRQPTTQASYDTLMVLTPVSPLRPGEGLIRYLDAAIRQKPLLRPDPRKATLLWVIASGGPQTTNRYDQKDYLRELCW